MKRLFKYILSTTMLLGVTSISSLNAAEEADHPSSLQAVVPQKGLKFFPLHQEDKFNHLSSKFAERGITGVQAVANYKEPRILDADKLGSDENTKFSIKMALLQHIAATPLSESSENQGRLVVEEIIVKVHELLTKCANLKTEALVFPGRTPSMLADVVEELLTLHSYGHRPQIIRMSISGSPDIGATRTDDKFLMQDLRNVITPKRLQVFYHYLDTLGFDQIKGDMIVADIANTGGNLNSLLRLFRSYYETKALEMPDVRFAGLNFYPHVSARPFDLHPTLKNRIQRGMKFTNADADRLFMQGQLFDPATPRIYTFDPRSSILTFHTHSSYTAKGFMPMEIPTIPLAFSKVTLDALDADTFASFAAGTGKYLACEWKAGQEDLRRPGPFYLDIREKLTRPAVHEFYRFAQAHPEVWHTPLPTEVQEKIIGDAFTDDLPQSLILKTYKANDEVLQRLQLSFQ